MTNHRTRFLVVSLVLSAGFSAASWVAAQARKDAPEPDSRYKYESVFHEALQRVREAYVKEVDDHQLMGGAYEGATDALGAFAVYVPAEQVAEYRRSRTSASRDMGLLMVRERGWVYVAGVEEASPAQAAGFERGDLVAKVDGEPTRDLQVWQIEAHLASHADRPVAVTVVRQGESHDLKVEAGPGAAPARPLVRVERVRDVPVLRIGRFETGTAAAVENELQKLASAGARKLVIDLRGTSNGDPEVAFAVADLLLAGELGTLKAREEVRERFAASGEPVWKGELVVLIDRGSLGASEVLAAVLDQAAEATLVGETSFGHAGEQTEVELSSGALLELTGAFYTGPNGELLDEGLEPDVEVDERSRRLGERDLSIDELILRRGVGVLAGEEQKKAA
jgi:carboxyl-terminal processing protease